MRRGPQLEMRQERLRVDRLVEAQPDDDRAVVLAVPVGAAELDGGGGERPLVRLIERLAGDRLRRLVDRDRVLRRERQRLVRREDQRRRAGPAELPLDRRERSSRTEPSRSAGPARATTIGSEKTTRISLASARVAVSPTGPALTMRSPLAADNDVESRRTARTATNRFITPCSVVRRQAHAVAGIARL